ncbi:MAG: hypothetical protein ACLFPM_01515 [Candidatus Izemoplasmatales bacterium]
MKKILASSLFVLMFGLLIGCNNQSDDLSQDFKVEGLSLDNEEDDGRSQYYEKLKSIMEDIENHSLYPGHAFLENQGEIRNYYSDGVSKDDYNLEDEKTLIYLKNAYSIMRTIQEIPYIQQGDGTTFYEENEISYHDSQFTTYANDDYVYYHSENDEGETVNFEVLVEEDNIKMTYYFESDTTIIFRKNDFNKGFLDLEIMQGSNNEYSYRYEFYNYQTDQQETTLYTSDLNILMVSLGDYNKGEILEYSKYGNSEFYTTTLLSNEYRDIEVMKSIQDDEILYYIYYNIMNVSDWDYLSDQNLYLNDDLVFYGDGSSVQFNASAIEIRQELDSLTQENYKTIDDLTYNGPITFEDIQTSLENAEAIADNYFITYTDSEEVDTFTLDSRTYTLEELHEFFESMISDKYQDTNSGSPA